VAKEAAERDHLVEELRG
jgi:hypothetical protein